MFKRRMIWFYGLLTIVILNIGIAHLSAQTYIWEEDFTPAPG